MERKVNFLSRSRKRGAPSAGVTSLISGVKQLGAYIRSYETVITAEEFGVHDITDLHKEIDLASESVLRLQNHLQCKKVKLMEEGRLRMAAEVVKLRAEKQILENEETSFAAEKKRLEAELAQMEATAAADRLIFEDEKAQIEERARDEFQKCQICMVSPRNVVLLPCSHATYCHTCVETHRKRTNTCPKYRLTITGSFLFKG